QLVATLRAVRTFNHDAGRGGILRLLLHLQHVAAVALPAPFQPRRQAQDDHVEEAAGQQAKNKGAGKSQRLVVTKEFQHARASYIAAASLKIGRYMPTTMAPTTPPMKIMMNGSIRLDRVSTALL